MNDLVSWIGDHTWVGWVGAAVALTLIELLSLDLVLLMFAVGALTAAVVAALGGPLWLCIVVFAALSMAMLAFARPKLARMLHAGPDLETGWETIAGRVAVVDRTVDVHGGRVKLDGETWTARTPDDSEAFEPNTEVAVVRIDGASLVVTRKAM